jgi:flagellar basal-body rod modification protein FlgD
MDSLSSITTASEIQMDYMKLLITQLQNQNPLEPMDNNEMASQLAQFSQLAQLESMNSSFAQVLTSVEHTYATSLIGKEVSFFGKTEYGDITEMNGVVKEVYNDIETGDILLIMDTNDGDYTVKMDGVISIKEQNSV